MGVKGLLPQLKEVQTAVSLEKFRGKTLAIDSYAWLHKSIISCAWELAQDQETAKYVAFFKKRVKMLKHFGIEPYFVFDGDDFGSKLDTELEREMNRKKNKEKGFEMLRAGEHKLATECFMKSIDVTPSMAKAVMEYLESENIKYVVAPYEADPQMVYLERLGLVHGIISEDSDLIVFGAKLLLTKLNDFGECIEINREDFKKCRAVPIGLMDDPQLRMVACLSGCDYTNGIPSIGIVKAFKLVKRFSNMHKCLMSLKLEGKVPVPNGFEMEYKKADISFQYQRVFNPITNEISTLNKIPSTLPMDDCEMVQCIGKLHDNSIHQKIAIGELDPISKEPLKSREEIIRSKSFSVISGPVAKISQKERIAKRSHSTPVRLGMKSIDSFFKSQARPSTKKPTTVPPKRSPPIPLAEISNESAAHVKTPTFKRVLLPQNLSPTSKRRKMFNQAVSSIQTPSLSKFFSTKRSFVDQPQVQAFANVSNCSSRDSHFNGTVVPLATPMSEPSAKGHVKKSELESSRCTPCPKGVLNNINSSDFDLTDPDDDEVETPTKDNTDNDKVKDTPANSNQAEGQSHEEITQSLYKKFGFTRDVRFNEVNSMEFKTANLTHMTNLKPIQQKIDKPRTTTIKTKRSITKNLTLDSFIYRGA